VFADQETTRLVPRSFELRPLNDNQCPEGQPADHPPSLGEVLYLRRGLGQPGGKLPLFDLDGQEVDPEVVRQCLARGWAEPWFQNPLKPDWLICKLTEAGRQLVEAL
jgi:hypothetical protein